MGTVIGSYPKPSYLKLPDVFQSNESKQKKGLIADEDILKEMNKIFAAQTPESQAMLEADIMQATEEVICAQCDCGVDIPTDGEVRRENYIHYLCRYIEGISF